MALSTVIGRPDISGGMRLTAFGKAMETELRVEVASTLLSRTADIIFGASICAELDF